MNRRAMRIGAAVGAAALTTLAAAPTYAAAPVSQASANAVTLSLAGNDISTGPRTATNDGSGEVVTGAGQLPELAGALDSNPILHIGVAGQTAAAQVVDGDGVSAACAGVAGDGGTLVEVDKTDCITPGDQLTLDLGNLDLSNTDLISFDPDDALTSAIAEALEPATAALIGEAVGPVTQQLSAALADTPLGEIGITGSLGAVEAICTAEPGTASGDAHIADANGGDGNSAISLLLPGQEPLELITIEAHPAPNTEVVVELDQFTQEILDALEGQLRTMVNGELGPIADLVSDEVLQTLQDQLIENLVDQLREPLLQPLQENVISLVLNKQVRPSEGAIEVTAFDLDVLPAAAAQLGFPAVELELGHVTCGPNSRVQAGETPAPSPEPTPQGGTTPDQTPTLPTEVDSGQGGDSTKAMVVLGATAALLALAGATGLMGYRRLLQK